MGTLVDMQGIWWGRPHPTSYLHVEGGACPPIKADSKCQSIKKYE
jgi:hypothetical protein